MAHPGGRPSKLDPVIREKLLSGIRNGHFLKDVCGWSGISYFTMNEWLQRGRGEHVRPKTAEYAKFAQEVEEANCVAKIKFGEQWKSHFPNSWQAIAAYMAVRWPDEFGKKSSVSVDLQGQVMTSATDAQIEQQLRDDPASRELLKEFYRRGAAFTGAGPG
jgi:hypothetical protein